MDARPVLELIAAAGARRRPLRPGRDRWARWGREDDARADDPGCADRVDGRVLDGRGLRPRAPVAGGRGAAVRRHRRPVRVVRLGGRARTRGRRSVEPDGHRRRRGRVRAPPHAARRLCACGSGSRRRTTCGSRAAWPGTARRPARRGSTSGCRGGPLRRRDRSGGGVPTRSSTGRRRGSIGTDRDVAAARRNPAVGRPGCAARLRADRALLRTIAASPDRPRARLAADRGLLCDGRRSPRAWRWPGARACSARGRSRDRRGRRARRRARPRSRRRAAAVPRRDARR